MRLQVSCLTRSHFNPFTFCIRNVAGLLFELYIADNQQRDMCDVLNVTEGEK